jgi:hypothetical protein
MIDQIVRLQPLLEVSKLLLILGVKVRCDLRFRHVVISSAPPGALNPCSVI